MAQKWPTYWSLQPKKTSDPPKVEIERSPKRRKVSDQEDQNDFFQRRSSPPSLVRLASYTLAKTAYDASVRHPTEEFWKDPKWQQVRTHLEDHLPPDLLQESYRNNFEREDKLGNYIDKLDEPCPSCDSLKEKIFVKRYPGLLIRWIFQQPIQHCSSKEDALFISDSPIIPSLNKINFDERRTPPGLLKRCLKNQVTEKRSYQDRFTRLASLFFLLFFNVGRSGYCH
jgi:hypothetical protein